MELPPIRLPAIITVGSVLLNSLINMVIGVPLIDEGLLVNIMSIVAFLSMLLNIFNFLFNSPGTFPIQSLKAI